MRQVLSAVHDDIDERGEPLASLYGSEGGIYETHGYGVASNSRTISIDADVDSNYLVSDVVAELRELMPTLALDPRVSAAFRGGTEDQEEDMAFLERAMLMALA